MRYIECPEICHCAGKEKSVFIAGGITHCPNWQKELIYKHLEQTDLIVLNPRRADFPIDNPAAAEEQITWEHIHLCRADAICFWFPCESVCPVALYELGAWNFRPKKLFIGCHPDYPRKRDIEIQTYLERLKQKIFYDLDEMGKEIVQWSLCERFQ